MASPYDSIIDDLSKNDPEFLKLSPDQQDSLVENLAQEKYGKIPNANKILDRSTKNNPLPFFKSSDIPKIAFQGAQGVVGNLPQNIVENPMSFATSGVPGVQFKAGEQLPGLLSKLTGIGNPVEPETTDFSDKYMNPETLGGKIAGIGANIAGSSIIPGIGAAKGVGKISESLRTEPVKRGIEDLIFQGSKTVEKSADDLFKAYNAKFGKQLDSLESTMTTDNFSDLITKSAEEIGKYDPSSNVLLAQLENTIKNSSKEMTARETQTAMKSMLNSVGDNRAKAILHKNYLEKISTEVPGLKELRAAHSPVYESAKGAKTLNKGLMRKVASGRIGNEEMTAAKEAQGKLGIDVLGPIEKQGNKLQKIIRNKKIVKGVATTGGIGWLINKLIGDKNT